MATHYGVRQLSPHTAAHGSQPWAMWFTGASDGNIDIDSDGEMSTPAVGYVDLSQMLSLKLGKQMSQMMIYELDYIRIELLNSDDLLNDNDTGASFSGYVDYYSPNSHKVNALKLAQKVERHNESGNLDSDAFLLSETPSYKGFRFGFDGDNQVKYPTPEGFSQLVGSEWDMKEIFKIYDTSSAVQTIADNQLWEGRAYTEPANFGFSTGYQNSSQVPNIPGSASDPSSVFTTVYTPESMPFTMENMNADVLGGLLKIVVTHSSMDDGANTTTDDDYRMRVTVGVKGWRRI
tara:strand:- start:700 stop:1572 length:873 start_codon:yes stop_codon:yes gene_type:complete